MANHDPNIEAGMFRLRELETHIAAAQADLAANNLNGDVQSAGQNIQQIADLNAQRNNLINTYNQYVASQQPVPQQPQTQEELQAKSWDKMTWDDALQLARTSKYGKDLDWRNPHVIYGYHEANRRRQRGE